MVSGYARVGVNDDAVQVRFENINSSGPGSFDAIRDRFYQRFPNAHWNWQIRRMVLPRGELNRLVTFCAEEFGPRGVKIEYQSSERQIGFYPRT